MATGGATGGRVIPFMSPIPPGTPAAPTVLPGGPTAAGPGKKSQLSALIYLRDVVYYTEPTLDADYHVWNSTLIYWLTPLPCY